MVDKAIVDDVLTYMIQFKHVCACGGGTSTNCTATECGSNFETGTPLRNYVTFCGMPINCDSN